MPSKTVVMRDRHDTSILCIIPARSGSVSVKHKNIRPFNGKPLLAHSILQALESKPKDRMRIVVSTDSPEYAKIAREWGAECPFLRPVELSGPTSTDYEFIRHCVDWMSEKASYLPDVVLQLRPTQPHRKVQDIDECIDIFLENRHKYDSLRTVVETVKSPYKMYTISEDSSPTSTPKLEPIFKVLNGKLEPFNMARQVLPKSYLHNGYVDLVNTSVLSGGVISGQNILPFVMNDSDVIDIDTEEDWRQAELACAQ